MTSKPGKTPSSATRTGGVALADLDRSTEGGDGAALSDAELALVSGGREPTQHPAKVTIPD
jgi:hypothetical protein